MSRWIVPDMSLSAEQLRTMSAEQVLAAFAPWIDKLDEFSGLGLDDWQDEFSGHWAPRDVAVTVSMKGLVENVE